MKTVSALFDTYAQGRDAANRLEAMGVPVANVSVVSNNVDGWYNRDGEHKIHTDGDAAGDAATGAGVGAAVGGAGGLLAGLGLMAIPGIGPVVAAGWLAATAAGALAGAAAGGAVGGIVGSMTKEGVPERDANLYAEGVRRGGTLVSARVDDAHVAEAQAVLDGATPVNLNDRELVYRKGGWNSFDPNAPAYTADQVVKERASYPRA